MRFAAILLALAALAAERVSIPYRDAQALPGAPGPQQFSTWLRDQDHAIRARLDQGEWDSMVHLLLFGTSFTAQPRMTIENLAEESRAGLLRARVDDLLRGLANPGANERLAMLRDLFARTGRLPTGPYILDHLQRVLKERVAIAQDLNLFRDRGVSLDTTILPNFAIHRALAELQTRGRLRKARRVAILGPGLDFIDKGAGFDYYPLQTLQPFAVQDSLVRLGLADPALHVTILDISPQVLRHVQAARKRPSYTMELPRDGSAGWTPEALGYWSTFGTALAQPVAALPSRLPNVETRAVRFPARALGRLNAVDLNIITQRLVLPPAEKFDLVIATNILVYYDAFQQSLAMANIAAMLAPGGMLLTNDSLPEAKLQQLGRIHVVYSDAPVLGDTVFWYGTR